MKTIGRLLSVYRPAITLHYRKRGTRTDEEKFIVLPYFWIPDENLTQRARRDHVPYDIWEQQGFIKTTEGNVVHYEFIEAFIEELGTKYNVTRGYQVHTQFSHNSRNL